MDKKIQNIYDNPIFFEGYQKLRKNHEGFNEQLEQPAIISLLPNLANLTILDIGCGFGDFSRYARSLGADKVVSIDPSEKMLHEAKNITNDSNILFIQESIENFKTTPNQFDLVVSSLVLHYVEDFTNTVKKIFTWIKTHGTFIFSVEHPIRTASLEYPEIMQDKNGKEYHPVYNYRDEVLLSQHWFIPGVQKYHRTLSTYLNTLIDEGFKIKKILEPMPSDQIINKNPNFSGHKIRPPILIIQAEK